MGGRAKVDNRMLVGMIDTIEIFCVLHSSNTVATTFFLGGFCAFFGCGVKRFFFFVGWCVNLFAGSCWDYLQVVVLGSFRGRRPIFLK